MFICMINKIMLMINKVRVDFLFEIPMCPSEVVVCVWQLGSSQSWMFAVRLSQTSPPGWKLTLTQANKGNISLSCLWQGWIWEESGVEVEVEVECVFYHPNPDNILVPKQHWDGLSSPGPCISPDTSNIANCKQFSVCSSHPIPSDQHNLSPTP